MSLLVKIETVRKLLLDLLQIQTPSKIEEPGIMYLKSLLKDHGVDNIKTYYISDRSYNLVVNEAAEPDIVFMAHIDTIPIIIPKPSVEDNFIVKGTGAVDTKGSIVAILYTIFTLENIPKNVSFVIVSQEETTGAGSHKYLENHSPKYGVILEPTNLKVANTHFGSLVMHLKVDGDYFHPDFFHLEKEYRERDAFLRFRKILNKLDEFSKAKGLNMSILKIETVGSDYFRPLQVDINLEIQIPPNEKSIDVYNDFLAFFKEYENYLNITITDIYEPYTLDDKEFLKRISAAYKSVFRTDCKFVKYHAWTDALHMHGFGVKTVVFGPGDPKLAHTMNEQVDVRDVVKAGKFILGLIENFQV